MSSLLDDLLDPEKARAIIDNPPPNHRVVEALEDAVMAIDEENYEEAERLCRVALQFQSELGHLRDENNLEGTSPSLIFELLGLSLDKQGKKEEALKVYEEAAKEDPDNASAYYQQGRLLDDLKRTEEAVGKYKQAVNLDSQFADAYYDMAIALRTLGRNDECIEIYEKVLEIEPDRIEALCNLGVLLKEADRVMEAVDVYEQAIRIKPDHGPSYFNMAIALKGKRGYLDKSIGAYQQALNVGFRKPDVYYGLGLALELKGHINEAIKSYALAVEGDTSHVRARYRIAVLVTSEGADDGDFSSVEANNSIKLKALVGPHIGAKVEEEVVALKKGGMPLEYIRQEFDCYANSFDTTLIQRLKYVVPDKLMDQVQPHIPSLFANQSDRVAVDLGCGTGLCGSLLRPHLGSSNRLVGIDISQAMLAKASERKVYDDLLDKDLVEGIRSIGSSIAFSMAADVLPYVGDLSSLFKELSELSIEGALFCFSVEDAEAIEQELGEGESVDATSDHNRKKQQSTLIHSGFVLHQRSGRYKHTNEYVTNLALEHRFEVASVDTIVGRYELGLPVVCKLYVLRKKATI